MKAMKKLAILVLSLCLIVPCFSMLTYAANGQIQFQDPQTEVGKTLELIGKVKKQSNTMGQIEINMTYDTAMLKFVSGDGATETASGKVTYKADATHETGNVKEFKLKFDVLKAGTTKVEIASATVKNVGGAVMDYTKGSSTITIAEGEGTTTPAADTQTVEELGTTKVDIAGKTYTIANTIPENEIPEGYIASTLDYDQDTYNVVQNETSGLILAYLVGEDGQGKWFMYVEEDATFAPYEEIKISDTVSIVLLTDVSSVVLPEEYVESGVILNDQEFPAWKNSDASSYYIFYAVNNKGEKSLYQFDEEELTYQRFTAPEIVEEKETMPFIGKLSDLLENHLDYVILGTGLGFILFILIIIILSVKLYNRNAELDEIYEEYGLDEEDTEDDVVLDLDDEEEDDEDEDEDYDDVEDDADVEVEFFLQEGMKELFPEETATTEEPVVPKMPKMVEEPEIAKTVDEPEIPQIVTEPKKVANLTEEMSIGNVLKKNITEQKTSFYDDEEDDGLLEDFSIDFIDLDD